MRSKVAVIVSFLSVLVIGGAALAVNTRILNTAPQPDIGRANEVLVPGGPQPATAPATPAAPSIVPTLATTAPPPAESTRGDDEHGAGERSTPEGAADDRDD